MKKQFLHAVLALVFVLGATAAQASVINITAGIGSDASVLEQSWLGGMASSISDSFEGYAPNAVDDGSGIALTLGTLYGYGHVGSSATTMKAYDEHATDGDQYWSNAAPNSNTLKGGFELVLNTQYKNALGFYSIDFHDVGGEVEITVNTISGSQTINLFPYTGVLASGTEVFWVIESDDAITSVEFHQSGGDGYAIDGVTTAATPIPAVAWLLGSGLLGLLGYRRTRS